MLLPAGALDLIHHNLPADLVSIILAKADDAHFADLVSHQSFASNSRDVSIPDMLRESNKRLIEPWIIQVPCLKQRRDKSNVEYNSIPITAADILQCVLHHNSGLPVILKDTRKVFASESDILHFEVHLSKWGYQGSPLAFTVATESIAKGLLRRYDKPAYHFCKESHDFLDVEEGSFAFIALGKSWVSDKQLDDAVLISKDDRFEILHDRLGNVEPSEEVKESYAYRRTV